MAALAKHADLLYGIVPQLGSNRFKSPSLLDSEKPTGFTSL